VLTRWVGLAFDGRYALVRSVLLALSGVGYLFLRDPETPLRTVDWALGAIAIVLGLVWVRWPLAGTLAQCAVLAVAFQTVEVEPVVPKGAASWAALELALRAPGRPLAVGVAALCAVYATDAADNPPGHLPTDVYRVVLTVGLPLLLGTYIRAVRQLAVEADERAAADRRGRRADALAARASERTAIARELHDVLAHHVASLVLRVGVARHVLPATDPRITEVLDDVHATGIAALADLRQLVSVLRDPGAIRADPGVVSIEPAALPAALRAAVDRAGRTGVTVDSTIDAELSTLDAVRGLAVLRLTQEALTNVAKHAGAAARATLTVRLRDRAVHWELTDDGGSGPPAVPGGGAGHGIAGMRERVALLGGTLEAGPAGTGWRVRTTLPADAVLAR
jgi:signal transduction histidine kinase